jgi:chromosome segregation ATPase
MTDNLDTSFIRLNHILDRVTETLSVISKERQEERKTISNFTQILETNHRTVNDLEKAMTTAQNNITTDMAKSQTENTIMNSLLTDKIAELENRIKQMDESMRALQAKYDENVVLMNNLQPKVGSKRKWWCR